MDSRKLESHSTLEACNDVPTQHGQNPISPQSNETPNPEAYAYALWDETLPEVAPSTLPEHHDPSIARAIQPAQKKRRLRKVIIIALVAAAVVIAAIVGGTVGGILGRRTSSMSPTCSNINIHCASALTATNRTDANGFVHRTISFQDPHNAIISRLWDSQNRTWTTANITDYFSKKSTPLPGPPMPGSPLASASTDGNLSIGPFHLWYLDLNRSICSVYLDQDSRTWMIDSEVNEATLTAGIALAATWQRPSGGRGSNKDGHWIVAYQSPLGDILTANSSNWATPVGAVVSSDVPPNSSLAIVPQLNGAWLDGLALAFENLGNPNNMEKTTLHAQWDHVGDNSLVTDLPANPQFAITQFDNWTNFLYLALFPDDKLTASCYLKDLLFAIPNIIFSGGPTNQFSSIATTTDAMFYGIFNDTIIEYSVDQESQSTFHYVGVVYP
ncbi:hypothetical protein CFAM422_004214 [Trichoderma lentiforme]|uniref:Fucose-specific lectin n=1 Tax=Trichoderma lentiforme TaxID=1567552 RepID=A0A9P4XJM9_9HYPO|nr:hypothetical protein CFAM422_004214 [Trichoderma lentiforme]